MRIFYNIYFALTILLPSTSMSQPLYEKNNKECIYYKDRTDTLRIIIKRMLDEIEVTKSRNEDVIPQINSLKELEERLNNLETKVKDCK